MTCPACTTENPAENLFCETCGQRLALETPAAAQENTCPCGTSETDPDGFCLNCGRRLRRPASDHLEQSLSPNLAAVSDRGLRHEKNEDRFALLQTETTTLLVVCDGVSSSRTPELAAATVAETISAYVSAHLTEDPETLLRAAIAQAQQTLITAAQTRQEENPTSTTVVAALVTDHLTVAWVGDSRAYWIDAAGAHQLTTDHSWLNDVTASGELTPAQAEASSQAHAITRWLGADSEEHATPGLLTRALPVTGTLLLTTDGIWNYAEDPAALAELVTDAHRINPEALAIARHLVTFANHQGGRDNATAALLILNAQAHDNQLNDNPPQA